MSPVFKSFALKTLMTTLVGAPMFNAEYPAFLKDLIETIALHYLAIKS